MFVTSKTTVSEKMCICVKYNCMCFRITQSNTCKIPNVWQATDQLLVGQMWPAGHMFDMTDLNDKV